MREEVVNLTVKQMYNAEPAVLIAQLIQESVKVSANRGDPVYLSQLCSVLKERIK